MLVEEKYVCSHYEMFIKNDSGKEREIFRVPYYPDKLTLKLRNKHEKNRK